MGFLKKNNLGDKQRIFELSPEELVKFIPDYIQNHPIERKLKKKWEAALGWIAGKGIYSLFPLDTETSTSAGDPTKNRLYVNRLLPILKTYIAKLFKVDPVIETIPAHGEIPDQMASSVCNGIISYVLDRNNYKIERIKVAANVFAVGRGWWKVFWDESMEGESAKGWKVKGDIRLISVNPWNVYWDDLAPSEAESRFVIHHYWLPYDLLKEKFYPYWSKKYKGSFPVFNTKKYTTFGNESKEGVPIYEYYERPSSSHPDGRTIIIADNTVLWEGPLPPQGIPLVPVKEAVDWGGEIDMSTIYQMIPVAKYYNKLLNFIMDNIEVLAPLTIAVPMGEAGITRIENIPGYKIPYPPGSPPFTIQPKGLPHHVILLLQTFLAELEEISGQHEVSHGKAPYANMPAQALNILLEQDDTKMSMAREAFYSALREVAIKILHLAQHKYSPTRLIRVVGENKRFEVKKVKGSDITFSDVRIEVTTNMPLTKQAQMNFAISLWQNRLIQDPQKILQLLGLDSLKIFQEQIMADVNKARRENELLKGLVMAVVDEDKPMPLEEAIQEAKAYVFPGDNHDTHLYEHAVFMKEDGYEQWGNIARQIFMAHWEAHRQAKAQLMQQVPKPSEQTPQEGQAQGGGGLSPEMLMGLLGQEGGGGGMPPIPQTPPVSQPPPAE